MRNSTGARPWSMSTRPRRIAAEGSFPASRRHRSNTRPIPRAPSRTWYSAETATKFPDIRWIFSHSGGTLPFLTGRFVRLAEERKSANLPEGPLPEFRKFRYELAQGNTPGQIAALLKLV